jgi:hypothetical protein
LYSISLFTRSIKQIKASFTIHSQGGFDNQYGHSHRGLIDRVSLTRVYLRQYPSYGHLGGNGYYGFYCASAGAGATIAFIGDTKRGKTKIVLRFFSFIVKSQ